tara:strand:- start:823 stop:1095 length:273 start_codon:yes stop_codon:yes gene_type:complete
MSIRATVTGSNSIVGSVSQGNQSKVTRVTVPGPAGPSGAAGGAFAELSDVDASGIADGAMIQYNGNTSKFEVTQEIATDTGEIRLNGGTF